MEYSSIQTITELYQSDVNSRLGEGKTLSVYFFEEEETQSVQNSINEETESLLDNFKNQEEEHKEDRKKSLSILEEESRTENTKTNQEERIYHIKLFCSSSQEERIYHIRLLRSPHYNEQPKPKRKRKPRKVRTKKSSEEEKVDWFKDFCWKLYRGEEFTLTDFNLTVVDLRLAKSFIKKKIKKMHYVKSNANNIERYNVSFLENEGRLSQEELSYINEALNDIKSNHPNCNRKFIYKNVIKIMKERSKEKKKIPKSKSKKIEEMFWNKFFGVFCERENVKISEVWDPLNETYLKNSKYKDTEDEYVLLLKSNELFYREFERTMEDILEEEIYIERKIAAICKKKKKDGCEKFIKHIERMKPFKIKKEIELYWNKFQSVGR